uniref:Tubby C-terminal domain-containing protein n=1 Tax=Globisporangium ultimum (strain ATCC 200006 / CBS 805.95 / DAOM BR144) TaxID=431595 RepID=K3WF25_GLOUD
MYNNSCFAEFQNLDTGKRSRVGVDGIWRQRAVFIYLDPEVTGARQPIAKVFRTNGNTADFDNDEYNVQVAPGVDIAFIVLVCGAMDDALQ